MRAEILPTTLSVISSHHNILFRRMRLFDGFPQHAIYASKTINQPALYAKGALEKSLSLFSVPLFLGISVRNLSSTATAH